MLDIVHQDERLIVFNKPVGLLSVPGIGPDKQDCLARRAAARFPGARIVHRLDRDTSGVLAMALDADAHRDLSGQFERREVRKVYVAVVSGVLSGESGQIDLPMRKDLDDPPRQLIDHEHGRSALTGWRVLGSFGDRSRLELCPLTGRSHQLRLHMQAIGHPILGDDLYAPPEIAAAADRLLLHATSLSLLHPSTGRRIGFEVPCPF